VGDVVQGNVYRHISFSATGAARMTNAAWAFTTSKTRANKRASIWATHSRGGAHIWCQLRQGTIRVRVITPFGMLAIWAMQLLLTELAWHLCDDLESGQGAQVYILLILVQE
jgi:hypothetical protein